MSGDGDGGAAGGGADDGDDSTALEIAALKAAWAEAIPAKLAAIARALAAVRAAPGHAVLLEDARTLAHRLRGTAGAYGHPALGVAIGRVEEALIGPGTVEERLDRAALALALARPATAP